MRKVNWLECPECEKQHKSAPAAIKCCQPHLSDESVTALIESGRSLPEIDHEGLERLIEAEEAAERARLEAMDARHAGTLLGEDLCDDEGCCPVEEPPSHCGLCGEALAEEAIEEGHCPCILDHYPDAALLR